MLLTDFTEYFALPGNTGEVAFDGLPDVCSSLCTGASTRMDPIPVLATTALMATALNATFARHSPLRTLQPPQMHRFFCSTARKL